MNKGKKKILSTEINLKKTLGIPLNVNFKDIRVLIGVPTRGLLSAQWVLSFLKQSHPVNTSIDYKFIVGKDVSTARDELVQEAIKLGTEYLIFIDDDVIIPPDTITKLINIADQEKDIVAGVYYSKQIPPEPLIFKGRGTGCFKNWEIGEIIDDIDGVGMGLTLLKTAIFKKIKRPWFKTVESSRKSTKNGKLFYSVDESLYFCNKAISKGFQITVDTSIQGIHFDYKSNTFYFNSEGNAVVVKEGKLIFPYKSL